MTTFLDFLLQSLVFVWMGVLALAMLSMVLIAAWVEALGNDFTALPWPRQGDFAGNVCACLERDQARAELRQVRDELRRQTKNEAP